MPGFSLHPTLARDTLPVTDLPLCTVRLMNNRAFPWLVLIPKREDAHELIDLDREEQHQLMDEIALLSHLASALFTPDKLNVAALGNQVPQLHVHLIARYKHDAAWPDPVWGSASAPYVEEESQGVLRDLRTAIDSAIKVLG